MMVKEAKEKEGEYPLQVSAPVEDRKAKKLAIQSN